MKKSELLREAKMHLTTPEEALVSAEWLPDKAAWLCTAIQLAAVEHPLEELLTARADGMGLGTTHVAQLCSWITGLIEPRVFLSSWLEETHGVVHDFRDPQYRSRLQRTRHAWLDWMIEYWEARGQ